MDERYVVIENSSGHFGVADTHTGNVAAMGGGREAEISANTGADQCNNGKRNFESYWLVSLDKFASY